LFSGDVDGDGVTETVLSALSGDIIVLRVRLCKCPHKCLHNLCY
jgi:hypothetical protein